MKNNVSLSVFTGILIFTLTGCMTPDIVKPDVPVKESSLLVVKDKHTAHFDGKRIGANRNIIPEGKHRLKVSEEMRYVVEYINYGDGGSKTTYIPYTEEWQLDYDFISGESYKIKLQYAEMSYNGVVLSTGALGVKMVRSGDTITVIHEIGTGIEMIDYGGGIGGGMAGHVYIGPFIVPDPELTLWDHDQSFFKIRIGPRMGVQVIGNNFETAVSADAGGEIGFGVPGFDSFGLMFGYYYGGSLTFRFFRKVGFSLGGGMTGGNITVHKFDDFFGSKDNFSYYFPYAEFDLLFLGSIGGIGFRYYFNDSENWYDKFSIGLKARF